MQKCKLQSANNGLWFCIQQSANMGVSCYHKNGAKNGGLPHGVQFLIFFLHMAFSKRVDRFIVQ